MTNQLDQAKTIYRDARRAGSTDIAAKRLARQQLPEFHARILTDPSCRGEWGRAVNEVKKELALPHNGNGNGHQPLEEQPTLFIAPQPNATPIPFTNAAELSCFLFDAWAARQKRVAPGDQYTLCPKQLVDLFHLVTGERVTSGAFVNPFLSSQNGRLKEDGWAFETLSDSHEAYTVKTIAIPRPPEPPAPEPQPPAPTPAAPPNDKARLFEEFEAFLAWRTANHA